MNVTSPATLHYCQAPDCPDQTKSTTLRCAQCQAIYYCSLDCQRRHWKSHKSLCGRVTSPVKDRIQAIVKSLEKEGSLRGFTVLKKFSKDWAEKIEKVPEYLKGIPDSDERELLSLINYDHNDVELDVEGLMEKFSTVPGVRVLEKTVSIDKTDDCANYVFKEKDWYQNQARNKLFGPYQEAIDFLNKQGYTPTSNPQVGDIVFFSSGAFPKAELEGSHYGIVTKIENNTIYIRSKWNEGYVFEHPFHIAPRNLGDAYTFLTHKNL